MIPHVLVCPPEERLLERLRRRAIVASMDDVSRVPAVAARVESANHLHALWLSWSAPVSELPVSVEWPTAPVVVYAPRAGPVRDLVATLPLLRRPGFQVMLSSDNEENYVAAALLASLNVHSGIHFGERPVAWEKLRTLLYYAAYSRASHAPVEPFDYVVANYDPASYLDPKGAFFDDPRRFLHLDADGRVALTVEDLRANRFVTEDLAELDRTPTLPAYRDRMRAWHEVFLTRAPCAYCPAWRICLGAFKASLADGNGCRDLCGDLLDAADFHRRMRSPGAGATWQ